VSLFGRRMTIVGLSGDTNAAGIFFAFAPLQTVQSMVGQRVVSDVAVHVAPGSSPPPALTAAVARIPKAHLIALGRLVSDDRHMIEAGFSQPVEILVAICLVVGLLITMMVLYTATVEHARDYALLKAIGTRPAVVSLVAVAQSLVLLVTGFLLGWGFAALLIAALRNLYPVINGYVEPGVLAEVAVFMVAVNLIALVLPLAFVRRVDPQEVFKA
jgi:putative ABC transport system permease protein